jgi:hypothetical protein
MFATCSTTPPFATRTLFRRRRFDRGEVPSDGLAWIA